MRIDPTVAAVRGKALASFATWLKYKRELMIDVGPQAYGH